MAEHINNLCRKMRKGIAVLLTAALCSGMLYAGGAERAYADSASQVGVYSSVEFEEIKNREAKLQTATVNIKKAVYENLDSSFLWQEFISINPSGKYLIAEPEFDVNAPEKNASHLPVYNPDTKTLYFSVIYDASRGIPNVDVDTAALETLDSYTPSGQQDPEEPEPGTTSYSASVDDNSGFAIAKDPDGNDMVEKDGGGFISSATVTGPLGAGEYLKKVKVKVKKDGNETEMAASAYSYGAEHVQEGAGGGVDAGPKILIKVDINNPEAGNVEIAPEIGGIAYKISLTVDKSSLKDAGKGPDFANVVPVPEKTEDASAGTVTYTKSFAYSGDTGAFIHAVQEAIDGFKEWKKGGGSFSPGTQGWATASAFADSFSLPDGEDSAITCGERILALTAAAEAVPAPEDGVPEWLKGEEIKIKIGNPWTGIGYAESLQNGQGDAVPKCITINSKEDLDKSIEELMGISLPTPEEINGEPRTGSPARKFSTGLSGVQEDIYGQNLLYWIVNSDKERKDFHDYKTAKEVLVVAGLLNADGTKGRYWHEEGSGIDNELYFRPFWSYAAAFSLQEGSLMCHTFRMNWASKLFVKNLPVLAKDGHGLYVSVDDTLKGIMGWGAQDDVTRITPGFQESLEDLGAVSLAWNAKDCFEGHKVTPKKYKGDNELSYEIAMPILFTADWTFHNKITFDPGEGHSIKTGQHGHAYWHADASLEAGGKIVAPDGEDELEALPDVDYDSSKQSMSWEARKDGDTEGSWEPIADTGGLKEFMKGAGDSDVTVRAVYRSTEARVVLDLADAGAYMNEWPQPDRNGWTNEPDTTLWYKVLKKNVNNGYYSIYVTNPRNRDQNREFLRWENEAGDTIEFYQNLTSTPGSYKAVWRQKYTATLDMNGASTGLWNVYGMKEFWNDEVSPGIYKGIYTEGERRAILLPPDNSMVKSDCKFMGWECISGPDTDKGKVFHGSYTQGDGKTNLAGDVAFRAVWNAQYTVTLHRYPKGYGIDDEMEIKKAAGEKLFSSYADYIQKCVCSYDAGGVTVSNRLNGSSTGTPMWRDSKGAQTVFNENSVMPEGGGEYYPLYFYPVTLDLGTDKGKHPGNGWSEASGGGKRYIKYRSEGQALALPVPQRSDGASGGYTFRGWKKDGGTEVEASASVPAGTLAPVSFTAIWRREFDVKKDSWSLVNWGRAFTDNTIGGGANGYYMSTERFADVFGRDSALYNAAVKGGIDTTNNGNCEGLSCTASLFFDGDAPFEGDLDWGSFGTRFDNINQFYERIKSYAGGIYRYPATNEDSRIRALIEDYQLWGNYTQNQDMAAMRANYYFMKTGPNTMTVRPPSQGGDYMERMLAEFEKAYEENMPLIIDHYFPGDGKDGGKGAGHAIYSRPDIRPSDDDGDGWYRIYVCDPNFTYVNEGIREAMGLGHGFQYVFGNEALDSYIGTNEGFIEINPSTNLWRYHQDGQKAGFYCYYDKEADKMLTYTVSTLTRPSDFCLKRPQDVGVGDFTDPSVEADGSRTEEYLVGTKYPASAAITYGADFEIVDKDGGLVATASDGGAAPEGGHEGWFQPVIGTVIGPDGEYIAPAGAKAGTLYFDAGGDYTVRLKKAGAVQLNSGTGSVTVKADAPVELGISDGGNRAVLTSDTDAGVMLKCANISGPKEYTFAKTEHELKAGRTMVLAVSRDNEVTAMTDGAPFEVEVEGSSEATGPVTRKATSQSGGTVIGLPEALDTGVSRNMVQEFQHNGDTYRVTWTGTVSYNGRKHVPHSKPDTKKQCPDIQVIIEKNGEQVTNFKVQAKKNRDAGTAMLKIQPKKDKGMKAAFKGKSFAVAIEPAEITAGNIKAVLKPDGGIKRLDVTLEGYTFKASKKDYAASIGADGKAEVLGRRNLTGSVAAG